MSVLTDLFEHTDRKVPSALDDWDSRVSAWCEDYCAKYSDASISEVYLDPAVFLFDHAMERVTLAYAVSTTPLMERDTNRMRGFPDVNVSIQKVLGSKAFKADRGHFLGYASGGELDINLFPHRRELNRGWSEEGKRFRKMELYVAEQIGTFFYHRPVYDDETWIPAILQYGVLVEDSKWWTETFNNK